MPPTGSIIIAAWSSVSPKLMMYMKRDFMSSLGDSGFLSTSARV